MNIRLSTKIKAFLISFLAVFLMVVLPHLGLTMRNIANQACVIARRLGWIGCKTGMLSPLPLKPDPMLRVRPQLQKNIKIFALKRPTSFISQAFAGEDFQQAKSYIVLDMDSGEILKEKDGTSIFPMASLTKVMTAMVALDLASPQEVFSVSETAYRIEPTRFAFDIGEKLTLEELLNGMLLTSANDCAQIIREGIDQKFGNQVFIKAMNEKAKLLGLKDTNFQNPQGFDDTAHFSSVENLGLMSRFALNNYPLIAEITKKDHEFYSKNTDHQEVYMNNWNGLIGVYPGVFGVKIGNTGLAGHTTVVAAERAGHRLLTVVLGAPGIIERDLWASKLLDLGFARFGLQPINVTQQDLREKYATWKY
ncbi:hypothetical protein A2631_02010 [Candidatus Daviesbacteria bacterium RIFCSPHIGHO2_01_FULL_44_29]|uniref:Peptidase S11 D-alanyl-D-alanine carboxypeptidase A N-terminal domain-containing protein n=1 Tax=Candidatus Daviesbacteria bacterium RIFCSPHIGHO2_02_FULL_43_12 TaxID=1797776 RepID=A0A1F5KKM6_9BACT|nr:MAG: hypothetical protein A2631_02010 [Candidatus Daviesbacteria bacterium RIFCSPHIGHO2_01_FULL_44_29]OGE39553.1 MAG: hypothetical protein A3E86_01890 [Candidatus Daviesbacteria bacterium RIFCSPHIGHO2_12_FULL_47_45]OGE41171.1 MAG: hypothetical protein A3D25_01405 [Candidatus Daviesbacteria bacterium RIFCSPHIGHO2_02_FULL_43_12]OGE69370.1 MAG: hypothetical protein A3B55_03145 [Candidatus Daviesbacteria bacterium RIFCSPLOWO2_01_FULL_43_15]